MAEPKWLKDMDASEYLKEDFDAKGESRYTVEGLDKNDPDWLDKAAEKPTLLQEMIMLSLIVGY